MKVIPKASKLPIIGNAYDLFKNPVAFALREYHSKGAVFEGKVFNKKIYFAGGHDVNIFFSRTINENLNAKDVWSGYSRFYDGNPETFLLCMEGQLHAEQRRIFMSGFSPKMLEDRYKLVSDLTVDYLQETINKESTLRVVSFVQRLTMEQLGVMCANTKSGEYYKDLTNYIRAMLNVFVLKAWPKSVFLLPKYKNAKKRTLEFAEQLIESHKTLKEGEEPDLVHDLVAAYQSGDYNLTFNDLRIMVTSPFSSGMDTVTNTLSTTLYKLAEDSELKQRVQKEVDANFSIGSSDLSIIKNMPIMHALMMEVLRMYPVAPYIPRNVTKDFEYEGYQFKKGRTFYVVQVLTHFLEELFPEPYKFDIDRYLPPREEHKQRGALNPYGMGAHKCVGLRLAEMQMMFTLCHLIKLYDWKLSPSNYKLKTRVIPTIGPEPKFSLTFFKR